MPTHTTLLFSLVSSFLRSLALTIPCNVSPVLYRWRRLVTSDREVAALKRLQVKYRLSSRRKGEEAAVGWKWGAQKTGWWQERRVVCRGQATESFHLSPLMSKQSCSRSLLVYCKTPGPACWYLQRYLWTQVESREDSRCSTDELWSVLARPVRELSCCGARFGRSWRGAGSTAGIPLPCGTCPPLPDLSAFKATTRPLTRTNLQEWSGKMVWLSAVVCWRTATRLKGRWVGGGARRQARWRRSSRRRRQQRRSSLPRLRRLRVAAEGSCGHGQQHRIHKLQPPLPDRAGPSWPGSPSPRWVARRQEVGVRQGRK